MKKILIMASMMVLSISVAEALTLKSGQVIGNWVRYMMAQAQEKQRL